MSFVGAVVHPGIDGADNAVGMAVSAVDVPVVDRFVTPAETQTMESLIQHVLCESLGEFIPVRPHKNRIFSSSVSM